MVERELPGITLPQLADAQQAAIRESDRMSGDGNDVRYIRSTWVPGDSRVMCLFAADTPERVREVNEAAGIPFTRIVQAMDLTP